MTWWTKFKMNVAKWYAYATAWVSAFWFAALAYWGTLDKTEQLGMLGSYLPSWAVSTLLFVIAMASFVSAKGWPQPKLAAKVEEARADIATAARVNDAQQTENYRRGD